MTRSIDIDDFNSKIQKTNGCFFWLGNKDKRTNRAMYKNRNAATIAWEIFNKEELEKGMIVKQICENKLCVRGDHLEISRKTYGWLQ